MSQALIFAKGSLSNISNYTLVLFSRSCMSHDVFYICVIASLNSWWYFRKKVIRGFRTLKIRRRFCLEKIQTMLTLIIRASVLATNTNGLRTI